MCVCGRRRWGGWDGVGQSWANREVARGESGMGWYRGQIGKLQGETVQGEGRSVLTCISFLTAHAVTSCSSSFVGKLPI